MSNTDSHSPGYLVYCLNDRKDPYMKRVPSSLSWSNVKIDELKNYIGGDLVFFEEDHLFRDCVPNKKEIECHAQLQRYLMMRTSRAIHRLVITRNKLPLHDPNTLKNSEITSLKDLIAKMIVSLEDMNTLKADSKALKADNAALKGDIMALEADIAASKADNAVLEANGAALKADDEGIKKTLSRRSKFEPDLEKILSQVEELHETTATVKTQAESAANGEVDFHKPELERYTNAVGQMEQGVQRIMQIGPVAYSFVYTSLKELNDDLKLEMNGVKGWMERKEEERKVLEISKETRLKDLMTKMVQLLEDIDTYLKTDISMALKADIAILEALNADLKAHNAALKTDIDGTKKTKERLEKLEWMLKPADVLHKNVTQETQKEPGDIELE